MENFCKKGLRYDLDLDRVIGVIIIFVDSLSPSIELGDCDRMN